MCHISEHLTLYFEVRTQNLTKQSHSSHGFLRSCEVVIYQALNRTTMVDKLKKL